MFMSMKGSLEDEIEKFEILFQKKHWVGSDIR